VRPAAPLLAWSLLTVVPMPSVDAAPRALARAAAFFPLVGAVLGAAVGGLGLLLAPLLPPAPTVALQLAAVALLTGALHLDGLMDTADGVLGGRTTERRLEIMRDSRVGAFGVAAAGLLLLAQFSCLVELSPLPRLIALVLALALGRWAMALALGAFPSARSDGLGAAYVGATEQWPAIVATALAVAVAVGSAVAWSSVAPAANAAWPWSSRIVMDLARPLAPSAVAGFSLALGALALGLAVAFAGGRWLAGRLGGLTGDTYGALCVLAETAVLYLAVALR
jgi:adenosylcobinamide-GDP ribazoletransferase